MNPHGHSAAASDGAGYGAKVGGVVVATLGVADGVVTDTTDHTVGIRCTDGNRSGSLDSPARSGGVRDLVQVV